MLALFLILLAAAIAGVTYALMRVTPPEVLAATTPRYWPAVSAAIETCLQHRQTATIVGAVLLAACLVSWLVVHYFAYLIIGALLVVGAGFFYYRTTQPAAH